MKPRATMIGFHRGKPRLWLEGAWLADAGFAVGAVFVFRVVGQTLVLDVVDRQPEGFRLRRVSRKTKVVGGNTRAISVIDINTREIPWHGPSIITTAANGRIRIHPA